MTFKEYLHQAWSDHATQSPKVAANFPDGHRLIQTNEELAQFAGIVTHVMGEHLGEWQKGISFLNELRSHSAYLAASETENTVRRSVAALQLASGTAELSSFSLSDQIRILAVASSALSNFDISRAKVLLEKALQAAPGLDKKDPANRALAVTGNNLAAAFQEKQKRSDAETDFMIFAAQVSRKYWEIAGTWLEVERAEYGLAQSYLHASEFERALAHGQKCLEICLDNKAGALEMFFGYEVMALIESKKGNNVGLHVASEKMKEWFAQLSPEEKPWCEPSLKKLGLS